VHAGGVAVDFEAMTSVRPEPDAAAFNGMLAVGDEDRPIEVGELITPT
jgi:hypothetical protein